MISRTTIGTAAVAIWLLAACEPPPGQPDSAVLRESRAWVLELAGSESPAVGRELAQRYTRHVGHYGDKRFFEELLAHPNWRVRRNVALALGHAGVETDFSVLRRAVDDKEDAVRKAAIQSLGRNFPDRARFALLLSLKDGSWIVRAEAVEMLDRIGDPATIRPIAYLLDDPDGYVRYDVVKALASFAAASHRDEVDAAIERYRDGLDPAFARRVELLVATAAGERAAADELLGGLLDGDWRQAELVLLHLARGFPDMASARLSEALARGVVPDEHRERVLGLVADAGAAAPR